MDPAQQLDCELMQPKERETYYIKPAPCRDQSGSTTAANKHVTACQLSPPDEPRAVPATSSLFSVCHPYFMMNCFGCHTAIHSVTLTRPSNGVRSR